MRTLNKKERGRKLCDQKANSVADLSAALDIVKRSAEVGGVVVAWNDILDAEFAETWPENVSHARLERGVRQRSPRVWPSKEAQETSEPVVL